MPTIEGGYRAALVLACALVVIECALFVYFGGFSFGAALRLAAAILLALGLWLVSSIARYLAGAWSLATIASVGWAMFGSGKVAAGPGLYWMILLCALSFTLAYVLLVSRKFASEFAELRTSRPKYKIVLGRLLLIALVAAALVATANDIYQLSRS